MSAPTPSEAVRVAVDEIKRLAMAFHALGRESLAEPSAACYAELCAAIDALAALSLHVGDAADSDTGASATPTALYAPALRASAPIAGAGAGAASERLSKRQRRMRGIILSMQAYMADYHTQARCLDYTDATFIDDVLYGLGVALDAAHHRYGQGFDRWKMVLRSHLARGIDSGEAGETEGLDPEGARARPEGARPEEIAQPSTGERHALPRLQVPVDEGLDANERDGKRQETPLTDLREVPTDQRPAAPPGAQEQAGVAAAQPFLHIEPETRTLTDPEGAS